MTRPIPEINDNQVLQVQELLKLWGVQENGEPPSRDAIRYVDHKIRKQKPVDNPTLVEVQQAIEVVRSMS